MYVLSYMNMNNRYYWTGKQMSIDLDSAKKYRSYNILRFLDKWYINSNYVPVEFRKVVILDTRKTLIQKILFMLKKK